MPWWYLFVSFVLIVEIWAANLPYTGYVRWKVVRFDLQFLASVHRLGHVWAIFHSWYCRFRVGDGKSSQPETKSIQGKMGFWDRNRGITFRRSLNLTRRLFTPLCSLSTRMEMWNPWKCRVSVWNCYWRESWRRSGASTLPQPCHLFAMSRCFDKWNEMFILQCGILWNGTQEFLYVHGTSVFMLDKVHKLFSIVPFWELSEISEIACFLTALLNAIVFSPQKCFSFDPVPRIEFSLLVCLQVISLGCICCNIISSFFLL